MSFTDNENAGGSTFKVKLREQGTVGRVVIFQASPEVAEARTVNYKQFDPVHAPGSIMSYINTASRTYSISAVKLVSRNSQEATDNLARLNLIRSWTMPVFGEGNPGVDDILGAPPKILLFSAYSSDNNQGNIYKIPTVITSLNISYPTDVDYIPTLASSKYSISGGTPFPVIMTIDLSLTETHSPSKYKKFNLNDFRQGKMTGF